LQRATERATQLANCLGLDAAIAPATDPFFAPTARAKQLVQRLKELKHELLLSVGDGRTTAAASFNLHDTFFGEAFRIRLPDGRPATDRVHSVRPRAVDTRLPHRARPRRGGLAGCTLGELAE
jgi:hypothetical protein